ncbi:MAG: 3-deoxy-7-phosphoheptulonate synthase [Candidatus Woesearchaeota archaeon]|jgi:3-deoxy-7-phosphoheptulonate synthase
MIITLNSDVTEKQKKHILVYFEKKQMECVDTKGSDGELIIVLGDTKTLAHDEILGLSGVLEIHKLKDTYTLISREFQKKTKIIEIKVNTANETIKIGGDELVFMAGPCSIENKEQILKIAKEVKKAGAQILRGGAYKPRTYPYSFQGLGTIGLKFLKEASVEIGLPIITESTGLHKHVYKGVEEEKDTLHYVVECTDIVQIGTRNMKSYGFLEEVAKRTKEKGIPILLKRGESATIDEFLGAAEYIVKNGNPNVILCLRGIRTFEPTKYLRYTSDIDTICVLKRICNLPVIFDPSHATGDRNIVKQMSLAAIAAGADGLIIEAHYDPDNAQSDGKECITADVLKDIINDAKKIKTMLRNS